MNKKVEIIRRLAEGESVSRIADSLGTSRQYVSSINRNQVIIQETKAIEEEWKKIEEEKRRLEELRKQYEFAIEEFLKSESPKKKVCELGLSARTLNVLKRNRIETTYELDNLTRRSIEILRGAGKYVADEIMEERKRRVTGRVDYGE